MRNRVPTEAETASIRAIARLDRLAARSFGDLSMAHYRVLSAVADGDERASRVATRFALGKPAISVAVDALSKQGLLTRLAGDGDQRVSTLALTPAGRKVLSDAEAAAAEALREVVADTDGLVEALVALGAAIEKHAQARAGGLVPTRGRAGR